MFTPIIIKGIILNHFSFTINFMNIQVEFIISLKFDLIPSFLYFELLFVLHSFRVLLFILSLFVYKYQYHLEEFHLVSFHYKLFYHLRLFHLILK